MAMKKKKDDLKRTCLLIVDVQNDFCTGGALEVKDGDEIVPLINKRMQDFNYDYIVASQDWHPANHVSFASNHKDKNPFDVINIDGQEQILWPDHCVVGSEGAKIHKELDLSKVNMILRKGTKENLDSYSAFADNRRPDLTWEQIPILNKTGLDGAIKAMNIEVVEIVGLAFDFCVKFSAIDAVLSNTSTRVHILKDLSKSVDTNNDEKNLKKMLEYGIQIIF